MKIIKSFLELAKYNDKRKLYQYGAPIDLSVSATLNSYNLWKMLFYYVIIVMNADYDDGMIL